MFIFTKQISYSFRKCTFGRFNSVLCTGKQSYLRHYNRLRLHTAQFILITWERVGLKSFKEKQSNLLRTVFLKVECEEIKKSLFLD